MKGTTPVRSRVLPLGEVVRFRNGRPIKPGGDGQYAAYGSNGVIGRSKESMYRKAIILGRVGAYCGSVAYCPDPFWASDNTIVVEPNTDFLDVRYTYYALIHANLSRHAGGAAQPLITQTGLRAVAITVPSLDVQRRIAGVLSAYDDLMEVNARRIAIMEEMTRCLFEEWFVKFQFPGHETASFVDTDNGRAPKGWAITEVKGKERRTPGSQPARPFSRPSHPQNAAKVRAFSRTASAFTAETDCLLEQRRFELSVPP
jgi:type I restriction enzyme, S subunit